MNAHIELAFQAVTKVFVKRWIAELLFVLFIEGILSTGQCKALPVTLWERTIRDG